MTTDEKRPHLLGVSQIGLSDLDMKEAESMTYVLDIMDFMDCRHIPYDGLETIEEYKARIRLEYNRQKRDSPKLTVSYYQTALLIISVELHHIWFCSS